MKHAVISSTVLFGIALITPAMADATIDSFGIGENAFTMDFVDIGNPGNSEDPPHAGYDNIAFGSVCYAYRMGNYEVSEAMINKANAAGVLGITLSSNGDNKPATLISWNEAARFVNWLNVSSGSVAAYKFNSQPGDGGYNANENIVLWTSGDTGYNAANPFRNSNAKYFLPSENEWYKAAYYSGTGSVYYDYPTGSDVCPAPVASGTSADTAVYGQPYRVGPADITNAGGLSCYGTMGQGGNVWELMETAKNDTIVSAGSYRGMRGGSWDYYAGGGLGIPAWGRDGMGPDGRRYDIGFRVASVSEPTAVGVDFKITSVSVLSGGSQLQMTWTSEPSATYSIEDSPDLAALSWTEVDAGILSQGSITTHTFDITPGLCRFFRVAKRP